MKELRTIVQAYQSIDFSSTRAALATVVRVEGSSYRRAGARMLVLDDGTCLGGISGGCLEGDALLRAQKGIALQRPSVITYDTTRDDDYQVGVGLGCNGIIDVLFTPLHPGQDNNPLQILSGLINTRQPAIVVAITGCPERAPFPEKTSSPAKTTSPKQVPASDKASALGRTLLYDNDENFLRAFAISSIATAVLEDIHASLDASESRTLTYDSGTGPVKVFIEVILPATHLVIYGGNYDMHTLLRQARELGWDTTLVMNTARADKSIVAAATRVLHDNPATRPQDLTATRPQDPIATAAQNLLSATSTPSAAATQPPTTTQTATPAQNLPSTQPHSTTHPHDPATPFIDAYTAVLLMAHDYKTDFRHLQSALPSPASYIGLLGPRKRADKMLETLASEGQPVSATDRQRIYAPAGLDIGATTPEEIALSILAEIRSHFAGRQGMPLRLREGTIYGNPARPTRRPNPGPHT